MNAKQIAKHFNVPVAMIQKAIQQIARRNAESGSVRQFGVAGSTLGTIYRTFEIDQILALIKK